MQSSEANHAANTGTADADLPQHLRRPLPQNAPDCVPLRSLLVLFARHCHAELLRLFAALAQQRDEMRKREELYYFFERKNKMIQRLIALVRWFRSSSHIADKLVDIRLVLMSNDELSKFALDGFRIISDIASRHALPPWDLYTARHVLVSKGYYLMPVGIQAKIDGQMGRAGPPLNLYESYTASGTSPPPFPSLTSSSSSFSTREHISASSGSPLTSDLMKIPISLATEVRSRIHDCITACVRSIAWPNHLLVALHNDTPSSSTSTSSKASQSPSLRFSCRSPRIATGGLSSLLASMSLSPTTNSSQYVVPVRLRLQARDGVLWVYSKDRFSLALSLRMPPKMPTDGYEDEEGNRDDSSSGDGNGAMSPIVEGGDDAEGGDGSGSSEDKTIRRKKMKIMIKEEDETTESAVLMERILKALDSKNIDTMRENLSRVEWLAMHLVIHVGSEKQQRTPSNSPKGNSDDASSEGSEEKSEDEDDDTTLSGDDEGDSDDSDDDDGYEERMGDAEDSSVTKKEDKNRRGKERSSTEATHNQPRPAITSSNNRLCMMLLNEINSNILRGKSAFGVDYRNPSSSSSSSSSLQGQPSSTSAGKNIIESDTSATSNANSNMITNPNPSSTTLRSTNLSNSNTSLTPSPQISSSTQSMKGNRGIGTTDNRGPLTREPPSIVMAIERMIKFTTSMTLSLLKQQSATIASLTSSTLTSTNPSFTPSSSSSSSTPSAYGLHPSSSPTLSSASFSVTYDRHQALTISYWPIPAGESTPPPSSLPTSTLPSAHKTTTTSSSYSLGNVSASRPPHPFQSPFASAITTETSSTPGAPSSSSTSNPLYSPSGLRLTQSIIFSPCPRSHSIMVTHNPPLPPPPPSVLSSTSSPSSFTQTSSTLPKSALKWLRPSSLSLSKFIKEVSSYLSLCTLHQLSSQISDTLDKNILSNSSDISLSQSRPLSLPPPSASPYTLNYTCSLAPIPLSRTLDAFVPLTRTTPSPTDPSGNNDYRLTISYTAPSFTHSAPNTSTSPQPSTPPSQPSLLPHRVPLSKPMYITLDTLSGSLILTTPGHAPRRRSIQAAPTPLHNVGRTTPSLPSSSTSSQSATTTSVLPKTPGLFDPSVPLHVMVQPYVTSLNNIHDVPPRLLPLSILSPFAVSPSSSIDNSILLSALMTALNHPSRLFAIAPTRSSTLSSKQQSLQAALGVNITGSLSPTITASKFNIRMPNIPVSQATTEYLHMALASAALPPTFSSSPSLPSSQSVSNMLNKERQGLHNAFNYSLLTSALSLYADDLFLTSLESQLTSEYLTQPHHPVHVSCDSLLRTTTLPISTTNDSSPMTSSSTLPSPPPSLFASASLLSVTRHAPCAIPIITSLLSCSGPSDPSSSLSSSSILSPSSHWTYQLGLNPPYLNPRYLSSSSPSSTRTVLPDSHHFDSYTLYTRLSTFTTQDITNNDIVRAYLVFASHDPLSAPDSINTSVQEHCSQTIQRINNENVKPSQQQGPQEQQQRGYYLLITSTSPSIPNSQETAEFIVPLSAVLQSMRQLIPSNPSFSELTSSPLCPTALDTVRSLLSLPLPPLPSLITSKHLRTQVVAIASFAADLLVAMAQLYEAGCSTVTSVIQPFSVVPSPSPSLSAHVSAGGCRISFLLKCHHPELLRLTSDHIPTAPNTTSPNHPTSTSTSTKSEHPLGSPLSSTHRTNHESISSALLEPVTFVLPSRFTLMPSPLSRPLPSTRLLLCIASPRLNHLHHLLLQGDPLPDGSFKPSLIPVTPLPLSSSHLAQTLTPNPYIAMLPCGDVALTSTSPTSSSGSPLPSTVSPLSHQSLTPYSPSLLSLLHQASALLNIANTTDVITSYSSIIHSSSPPLAIPISASPSSLTFALQITKPDPISSYTSSSSSSSSSPDTTTLSRAIDLRLSSLPHPSSLNALLRPSVVMPSSHKAPLPLIPCLPILAHSIIQGRCSYMLPYLHDVPSPEYLLSNPPTANYSTQQPHETKSIYSPMIPRIHAGSHVYVTIKYHLERTHGVSLGFASSIFNPTLPRFSSTSSTPLPSKSSSSSSLLPAFRYSLSCHPFTPSSLHLLENDLNGFQLPLCKIYELATAMGVTPPSDSAQTNKAMDIHHSMSSATNPSSCSLGPIRRLAIRSIAPFATFLYPSSTVPPSSANTLQPTTKLEDAMTDQNVPTPVTTTMPLDSNNSTSDTSALRLSCPPPGLCVFLHDLSTSIWLQLVLSLFLQVMTALDATSASAFYASFSSILQLPLDHNVRHGLRAMQQVAARCAYVRDWTYVGTGQAFNTTATYTKLRLAHKQKLMMSAGHSVYCNDRGIIAMNSSSSSTRNGLGQGTTHPFASFSSVLASEGSYVHVTPSKSVDRSQIVYYAQLHSSQQQGNTGTSRRMSPSRNTPAIGLFSGEDSTAKLINPTAVRCDSLLTILLHWCIYFHAFEALSPLHALSKLWMNTGVTTPFQCICTTLFPFSMTLTKPLSTTVSSNQITPLFAIPSPLKTLDIYPFPPLVDAQLLLALPTSPTSSPSSRLSPTSLLSSLPQSPSAQLISSYVQALLHPASSLTASSSSSSSSTSQGPSSIRTLAEIFDTAASSSATIAALSDAPSLRAAGSTSSSAEMITMLRQLVFLAAVPTITPSVLASTLGCHPTSSMSTTLPLFPFNEISEVILKAKAKRLVLLQQAQLAAKPPSYLSASTDSTTAGSSSSSGGGTGSRPPVSGSGITYRTWQSQVHLPEYFSIQDRSIYTLIPISYICTSAVSSSPSSYSSSSPPTVMLYFPFGYDFTKQASFLWMLVPSCTTTRVTTSTGPQPSSSSSSTTSTAPSSSVTSSSVTVSRSHELRVLCNMALPVSVCGTMITPHSSNISKSEYNGTVPASSGDSSAQTQQLHVQQQQQQQQQQPVPASNTLRYVSLPELIEVLSCVAPNEALEYISKMFRLAQRQKGSVSSQLPIEQQLRQQQQQQQQQQQYPPTHLIQQTTRR